MILVIYMIFYDNSLRKSARSDFAKATSDRSAGNPFLSP
jgi:hypothetical protein